MRGRRPKGSLVSVLGGNSVGQVMVRHLQWRQMAAVTGEVPHTTHTHTQAKTYPHPRTLKVREKHKCVTSWQSTANGNSNQTAFIKTH